MSTKRRTKDAPNKRSGGPAKGIGAPEKTVSERGPFMDSLDETFVHVKSPMDGESSKVSGIQEETYIGMQSRGVVALPAGIRKRHGLDRPGAQMRMVEREDGVIELHPQVPVPASQAWFWDARWQKMEAEAEADIAEGRITRHQSLGDLMDHITSIGDAD